jgi:hypothetical protein
MQHATECSAEPYEPPSRSNMNRQSMHLTNYSVAKCGPHAPSNHALLKGFTYWVPDQLRCRQQSALCCEATVE